MSKTALKALTGAMAPMLVAIFVSTSAGCDNPMLGPTGNMTGGAGGAAAGSAGSTGVSACGPSLLMSGATGTIAFDSDQNDFNRDLYTIAVDGSALTRLTTDPSNEKEPAFSPDGQRVSFSSDRSGTFQIYLLDLATMEVTQVTNLPDGADQSSFSHDGTLIAFHSDASVWVVHPDATGATQVATALDSFNAYFWPHFSADDTELVFDRNNEIDAVHLDGLGFRQIVQNWTTKIKSPAVAPGGTDVAYAVSCDSALSVWTTPFSTTTEPCMGRRVTPVGDLASQRPTWGPNNLIAYERVDPASNIGSIAVISRTTGSVPCLLTPGLADNRNPTWSF
jgi:dipeptidyl aminopeptidase/acylaminoacyl peptidase